MNELVRLFFKTIAVTMGGLLHRHGAESIHMLVE